MNLKEVIEIAKGLDIPYKSGQSKAYLIRAIQSKEGNTPCYRKKTVCNDGTCLWMNDCMDRLGRLVPDVKRSLADEEERKDLKQRELELEATSRSLKEANTALKVLLKQRHEDKDLLEEQILTNIKKTIMPSIERLKHLTLNDEQIDQLKVIEKQLQDIASPFTRNLSTTFRDLTSREIQVALLIKEGMRTKEIAKNLSMTEKAVWWHRRNLRVKLGIVYKAINIRSHLMSMD